MNEINQRIIFSNNLNRYLAKHDLTQAEVASYIGVSPQTFNTWCKGIAIPRMGKIQRLADFFGINKSDLIDLRRDDPEPVPSDVEMNLIRNYRMLNEEGQEKLIGYADDLIQSGKYIKSDPDRVVDEA